MVECSECGAEIEPEEKLTIGDLLECPECAAELQVVDNDPLTVEAVGDEEDAEGDNSTGGEPEDEEDWLQ